MAVRTRAGACLGAFAAVVALGLSGTIASGATQPATQKTHMAAGYANARRQWIKGAGKPIERVSYFNQSASDLYAVLSAGGGDLITYPRAMSDLYTLSDLPETGATPEQKEKATTAIAKLNRFFDTSVPTSIVNLGFPLRPGTTAPDFLVQSVSFVSDEKGFGLMQGASPSQANAGTSVDQLAVTTDGGLHWVAGVRLPTSGDDPLPCCFTIDGLAFGSARLGYTWDQGEVFETRNGGRKWMRLPSPAGPRPFVVQHVALLGNRLFVVYQSPGNCDTGGADSCAPAISVWDGAWRRLLGPLHGEVIDLLSAQGHVLYAYVQGVKATSIGRLLVATAQAASWTSHAGPDCGSTPDVGGPGNVAVSDGAILIECDGAQAAGWGARSFWLSTDGGTTWSLRSEETDAGVPQVGTPPMSERGTLTATPGQFWFAPGYAGSSPYVSLDGGINWAPVAAINTDAGGISDLDFVDAQHGWCVTDLGIWRTLDGGTTWTRTGPPPPRST